MSPPTVAWRKRLSHRIKERLYRLPAVDARIDAILAAPASGALEVLRELVYLRLLPERRVRRVPFARLGREIRRQALVLSLVPPEDTGGGSRPAQLAAELRRRGFAIDWTYALPIFPWPRGRRPDPADVRVRHVSDPEHERRVAPDLCLVEAPHPHLLAALDRAPRPETVVYDAIDIWDGSLGAGWYDPAAEAETIARADLLVASSELLRDRLADQSGRPVTLVPNAVDLRLFDPGVPRERPGDVRPGRPTVLYVGALWGEWVDVRLIAAVARALPAAEVHLLGPTGGRVIPALPNLHVLGPRPREEVPAYLAAADVAIVPFVGSRLADAVSPLKVFEYLAMGVPVVSTPIAELAARPGVIAIAADESAFARAVDRAAAERQPPDRIRAEVAAEGWSARVDRILGLVETRRPGDDTAATRRPAQEPRGRGPETGSTPARG